MEGTRGAKGQANSSETGDEALKTRDCACLALSRGCSQRIARQVLHSCREILLRYFRCLEASLLFRGPCH